MRGLFKKGCYRRQSNIVDIEIFSSRSLSSYYLCWCSKAGKEFIAKYCGDDPLLVSTYQLMQFEEKAQEEALFCRFVDFDELNSENDEPSCRSVEMKQ
jgi:hypothetical protein